MQVSLDEHRRTLINQNPPEHTWNNLVAGFVAEIQQSQAWKV